MTPHRAALFVRRVVRGYGLAESHARALLAVVSHSTIAKTQGSVATYWRNSFFCLVCTFAEW
jgi:hypothetical protein